MSSILLVSLGIVLGAAILGFRARKTGTAGEFWLNDGRTKLAPLVATIVATQVGAGTVLGIAASTFESGTGFGLVALISTMSGLVALAAISPKIRQFVGSTGIVTLPEFIGLRFGKTPELSAGIVTAIAYVGLLAGQIVALAAFLEAAGLSVGINTIWIAGVGAIAYCAFSGLKGDIEADKLFFAVMLIAIGLAYSVLFINWPGNFFDRIDVRILSPITFGGYTYLIAGVLFGAVVPIVSMEFWLRIFASHDENAARKSFYLSAVIVVPFYVLPLLVGLAAAALQLTPQVPETIFLEFFTTYAHPIVAALIGGSLTAVILSTANTYSLILAGVIARDILPLRANLQLQRFLVLIIGLASTAVAFLVSDLVSLILGAFYVIIALFPAIVATLLQAKIHPWAVSTSMIVGAISAIATYPILGPQAFLPALLTSGAIVVAGRFFRS